MQLRPCFRAEESQRRSEAVFGLPAAEVAYEICAGEVGAGMRVEEGGEGEVEDTAG